VRLRQTPPVRTKGPSPLDRFAEGVRLMTKASMSCGAATPVVVWAPTAVASVTGCHPEQCDVVVGS